MLILSGILAPERDAVREAFADATVIDESHEDEWVGIVLATVAVASGCTGAGLLELDQGSTWCQRQTLRQLAASPASSASSVLS